MKKQFVYYNPVMDFLIVADKKPWKYVPVFMEPVSNWYLIGEE